MTNPKKQEHAERKLNAIAILYDMPALRRIAKSPGKQLKIIKRSFK